jgi:hypothetical protein
LFKDIDDARAVIRQIALDEADTAMTDAHVQVLLDRLIPQFWITGGDQSPDEPGTTRFGGAPDLPKGIAWPMRSIAHDAAQRAEEMDRHLEWIARHIVRELPFEFLAQIDLAEASRHAAHAKALPSEGRLLFFWDGVVGLHVGGPAACRVIWDRSPRDGLQSLATPTLLHELEAAYDPSGKFKKPYIYPSRAMRLAPMLHLPNRASAEFHADAALRQLGEHEDHDESYSLLTALDEGQFTTTGRGARRQRFLGSPDPEQDDPRFDVIVADGFTPPPWDARQVAEASRVALDWQLLLQLDLGDLSQQDLTEGSVYFVIRKRDLDERNFSRVHAIYQQT